MSLDANAALNPTTETIAVDGGLTIRQWAIFNFAFSIASKLGYEGEADAVANDAVTFADTVIAKINSIESAP